MLFNTALTVAALLSSAAAAPAAVGKARIVNNCTFSVTAWSVGSAISNPVTLAHGGSYAETFTVDPKTGGRALKLTLDADGLYTGKPQTDYSFSLQGSSVWYDMSDVFGDAFSGHKLVVASADKTCEPIVWQAGVPPAGSQVKVCGSSSDVTLTLCSA